MMLLVEGSENALEAAATAEAGTAEAAWGAGEGGGHVVRRWGRRGR
ncbi:MAG TPA: hypothetical protein VGF20_15885 [Candidatus Acidoferrum sp.]